MLGGSNIQYTQHTVHVGGTGNWLILQQQSVLHVASQGEIPILTIVWEQTYYVSYLTILALWEGGAVFFKNKKGVVLSYGNVSGGGSVVPQLFIIHLSLSL